jgi:hypothetical protein
MGFEASSPVSVYVRSAEGAIISKGATLKLSGTGMENVKFTPSVTVIGSGSGYIEVELEKGTYSFK